MIGSILIGLGVAIIASTLPTIECKATGSDRAYKRVYKSRDEFAVDRDNWLFEGYEMEEVAGGIGYVDIRFSLGFDIFYIKIEF